MSFVINDGDGTLFGDNELSGTEMEFTTVNRKFSRHYSSGSENEPPTKKIVQSKVEESPIKQ
jgi:hypothetical protein